MAHVINHRLTNSISIFSAELFAIYSCLTHLSLLPLPPCWFNFLSPSHARPLFT